MLTAEKCQTVYIIGASAALMDKVRGEVNTWADGNENLCMTLEEAMQAEELVPLLNEVNPDLGCDVILSV